MPGREINLLPEETFLKKEKEKHHQKSIFRSTVMVIFAAGIIFSGVFFYAYYLQNQMNNVKKQMEIERQKIEHMKRREIFLLWTKTKVLGIQQLLSSRPMYDAQLKALDFISGFLNKDLVLTDYTLSGKNFEFTIRAANSSVAEDFINHILAENKSNSHFQSIMLETADLQKGGGYEFSFATTLSGR